MNYGARIKDVISDYDLKQKSLAKQLNISEQMMSNYVNGRSNLPVEVIVQLARILNTTSDYLLGLSDNMEKPLLLTAAEQSFLSDFRSLSREQKELILQNILLMKQQNNRG